MTPHPDDATDESWLPKLGGRAGLEAALDAINVRRAARTVHPSPIAASRPASEARGGEAIVDAADALWTAASHRLAVYGTLAPGEVNQGVLAPLAGRWVRGAVRGRLATAGWGAAHGFPGLVLDPHAERVAVQVFCSAELPGQWARLDDFEGPEYVRLLVPVELDGGALLVSNLYALRLAPEHG